MFKLFISTIFLTLSIFVYSQGASNAIGIISGKIQDVETEKPIDYASFRLFSVKDSSVVAGIYTDVDGKFVLEQIPFGSYYAKITFLGYSPLTVDEIKITPTISVVNLGVLKMIQEKTTNLGEVKIVGQLDVLKTGIDKKIYNVGEDLSVKGGTANDVLNNVPSVEVDQEGNVTLRGDGSVTILIDGRPSSLSGGNGKTLLDALPAGSIERIEVVTNPSAKYDPDGTSGIINIVLKKNKLRGFNGLITANVGTGDFDGGNVADGSASLSFRNSKLNVFGSYSGRYMEGYRNNYSYLEQTFSSDSMLIIDQERIGTDQNFGHTFRIGSDFYLKARHQLGVSMTGNIGERNRYGDQSSVKSDMNSTRLANWQRIADDPTQSKNIDANLNYKFDFKEDKGSFTLDMNQSLGNSEIQGYYDQNNFALYTDSIISRTRQQLSNSEKNNITSVQADFVFLLPQKKARIETGTKGIVRHLSVHTYSESFDFAQNAFYEDTLANFEYSYDEQVYSVYGIFGQELGKFKYQGGVRFEKAYQIPNLISDTTRIVNDYFNFFPSGHIRYALGEKTEMSLSYSRRINRAKSEDLNPFTNYADPYNLQRGNPYLQPEFINSYDLGISNERKKMNFSASVFYRHTVGVITRVKVFYPDNTSAVTFANLDESHSVGTEAVVVYKPYKWWRNTFSVNANYTQYKDDNTTANWNVGGFNWNAKYSGSVEFWNRTASIQVNAAYNAPRITVQGTHQRRGPVDISGEKSFNSGKWTLGFRVSDIFNRQGFYMQVDQPGIHQEGSFKWMTRRVYLTFSYKFGKLEISNKNRAGNGEGGFEM